MQMQSNKSETQNVILMSANVSISQCFLNSFHWLHSQVDSDLRLGILHTWFQRGNANLLSHKTSLLSKSKKFVSMEILVTKEIDLKKHFPLACSQNSKKKNQTKNKHVIAPDTSTLSFSRQESKHESRQSKHQHAKWKRG